jgi:hypothetical protein
MTGHLLLVFWREQQGLCLLVLLTLFMAGAWFGVLWEYQRGRHQSPRHWYSGYAPPEFTLPSRWSLSDLNQQYERPAIQDGTRGESAPARKTKPLP